MCGIVGNVVDLKDRLKITTTQKYNALSSIKHRGPDAQGEYCNDNIWFGHARLSILDLSSGANQPMVTADGRYVICYNGEVYNYVELTRFLHLIELRTHSDTEVVLHAFARLNIDSFKLFNGMFAFTIYDDQSKKVWLVRDRLGIKPLYYRLNAESLSFASEIKALLCINNQSLQCNLSAVHEWLYYGNTLGEQILYQGIYKLLPGHYLELDLATFKSKVVCYWSPREFATPSKYIGSASEQIKTTHDLIEQAVKRQLVSDTPVGIFLSGGVDSSAITAFASRYYVGKLATYSAGFDFESGINELPQAKKIAQLYGTDHHELHISGVDIADAVVKMVEHHDMPFSDAANIPLYLLSSKINNTTKVILQGDGGDEMFGGYRRYTTLSFYKVARVLAQVGKVVSCFMPRNSQYYHCQRYLNALTSDTIAKTMALLLTEEDVGSSPAAIFTPEIRQQIMKVDPFIRYIECQNHFKDKDIVSQMFLVDVMIILPDIFLEKVDRSTMAGSIEVRVPFLDNDLVDFCLKLSGSQKVRFGKKKWLLKQALRGVVPTEVLCGPKTGFGVPYGHWLRGETIKSLFFAQLETFKNKYPGVLDLAVIYSLYNEHKTFFRDRSFLLWKILNFIIWANLQSIRFT
jgi:asparagine synthase (glutamine-hydrolysing)